MNPTSSFRSIGDLRAYLAREGQSPETLAAKVPVSNMTWRRLLQKADDEPLPEKYRQLLERHLGDPAPADPLDPLSVVTSGLGQSETQIAASLEAEGEHADLNRVARESESLATKAVSLGAPERLKADLSLLLTTLGSAQQKVHWPMILGALLYFLNPFDLIADGIAGVGFIDDIGILSIVASRIRHSLKR